MKKTQISYRYIPPREFAEIIGKSQQWVFRNIASGNINTSEIEGCVMIPRSEVNQVKLMFLLPTAASFR